MRLSGSGRLQRDAGLHLQACSKSGLKQPVGGGLAACRVEKLPHSVRADAHDAGQFDPSAAALVFDPAIERDFQANVRG